jgi:hypothetical protein
MAFTDLPDNILNLKESPVKLPNHIHIPAASRIKKMTLPELNALEEYYYSLLESRFGPEIWAVLDTLEHVNQLQLDAKNSPTRKISK